MGKHVCFGGLLFVVAACGGGVDHDPASRANLPEAQRDPDQGLYLGPEKGGPEQVAEGVGTPSAIAMTDERVVFTTRTTTVASEQVQAGGLFVKDKHVGPALMLSVDRQGASFDALTTDGTTAFVATSDGRLLVTPVSGGETKTLATLAAPAVVLATSGKYVYFASNNGALARIAKTGGEAEPLATITGAIRGLEADDVAAYVATGAAEETPAGIVRVPLDGSAVKVLTSGAEPCAMIRDGRSLFWTSLAPATETEPSKVAKGEVRRISLDGGQVATVASGAFSACAIAADEDSLYFATTVPNALPVKSGGAGTTASGLGLMRAPI
ncbi:MAG: hypothetical protein JWP87_6174, partial [Labilithrix sp.]|nr:hypothetical protein [Labilithrix sp.]